MLYCFFQECNVQNEVFNAILNIFFQKIYYYEY